MEHDEAWLFEPVAQGWCRYESLIDGTLSLEDVARMNDVMAVRAENQARARQASEGGR